MIISNAAIIATWIATNIVLNCTNYPSVTLDNGEVWGRIDHTTQIVHKALIDMGELGRRGIILTDKCYNAEVTINQWVFKPGAEEKLDKAVKAIWQRIYDRTDFVNGLRLPSSLPNAHSCTNIEIINYILTNHSELIDGTFTGDTIYTNKRVELDCQTNAIPAQLLP